MLVHAAHVRLLFQCLIDEIVKLCDRRIRVIDVQLAQKSLKLVLELLGLLLRHINHLLYHVLAQYSMPTLCSDSEYKA